MNELVAPHASSGFLQHGYVTFDLDKTLEDYSRLYGTTEFLVVRQPAPGDGSPQAVTRLALAYAGHLMLDIVEADRDVPSIFNETIKAGEEGFRLHHYGHLVDDVSVTSNYFKAQGLEVPIEGQDPYGFSFAYVDMRATTGLFTKFIHFADPDHPLLIQVPRN